MTRLGVAVRGPQILYRGIWPTYLAAPVAAAATAARLLGLDEARTGHALSLAFMLMAGGVGRIHGAPSGRWFLYANAVAGGVAAAEAARADYRGDPEILDKNWLADTPRHRARPRSPDRKDSATRSVYAGAEHEAVLLGQAGDCRRRGVPRDLLDEVCTATRSPKSACGCRPPMPG